MSNTRRRDESICEPGTANTPRSATPATAFPAIGASRRRTTEPWRQEEPSKPTQKGTAEEPPTIVMSLDGEFHLLKTEIQPDDRGRITIGQEVVGGQRYRVLVNANGQILLDPVVTIPTSELWLLRNAPAFASVLRGVTQAQAGALKSLGSFAEFTEGPDEEDEG